MSDKLGFIGGGNMASAMVSGILSRKLLDAPAILVSDPDPTSRDKISSLGVRAVDDNAEVVRESQTIFLCVKPQSLAAALQPVAELFEPEKHLLVSILAGVPTFRLEAIIPRGTAVVRVMPNTPMLVGEGLSAVCPGRYATEEQLEQVGRLLESCSEVITIGEEMMDAVTAVSGSGPAYLFYLAEAIRAGAIAVGFDETVADKLALKTLSGSARLLAESDKDAAQLRIMVTSKGGTTQAATEVLDAAGVMETWKRAIIAARDRSAELGKNTGR